MDIAGGEESVMQFNFASGTAVDVDVAKTISFFYIILQYVTLLGIKLMKKLNKELDDKE